MFNANTLSVTGVILGIVLVLLGLNTHWNSSLALYREGWSYKKAGETASQNGAALPSKPTWAKNGRLLVWHYSSHFFVILGITIIILTNLPFFVK